MRVVSEYVGIRLLVDGTEIELMGLIVDLSEDIGVVDEMLLLDWGREEDGIEMAEDRANSGHDEATQWLSIWIWSGPMKS